MRREITLEEVAKHSTEDDCWIIMHDLVLALPTSFLEEHPGGGEVISIQAGKDVTSDFEDIAHSDQAKSWAAQYIIGWKEGASEETKAMTTFPKTVNGGASGMLGPAVLVLIVAMLAFFFFSQGGSGGSA